MSRGDAGKIYSATYSNVPVYELTVESNHVMRRRSDDWINATHILKVADYDKPARTRILEREVQKGVHEKVQGGYGKYQGMSPEALLAVSPCTNLRPPQEPGSLCRTEKIWRQRMAFLRSCGPSSSLSQETEALLLLPNMPPPHRANQEFRALHPSLVANQSTNPPTTTTSITLCATTRPQIISL